MKKIILLILTIFFSSLGNSQTVLEAGDIAFMGSNTDGTTNLEDNFAFVLLKDIDAATTIIFTDRGWNDDSNSFFDYPGDSHFIWTSGVARKAGDIVTLDFSNFQSVSSAYSYIGDQLFAIQGSLESPTFIVGLQFNDVLSGGDDLNWDGSATDNATSALPDALTNGDTAVRLVNSGGIEQDNWQFSCALAGSSPISGTPAEIRAILHDRNFWQSSNTANFNPTVESGCPVNVNLGVAPEIVCPATVTVSTQPETCNNVATFEATDTVGVPESTITYSHDPGSVFPLGTTTVTATATNSLGTSICTFDVIVVDDAAPTAACNNITVQLNESGIYVLDQADLDAMAAGSNDACGIKSVTAFPNSFSCSDIGGNDVELTFTDDSGNSSTCTAVVNVEGVIPVVTITEGVLPEFCQSSAIVLTANSTEADTYQWTTGETTNSIEVGDNGTYEVTVTSVTGCTTTAEYTVTGFDAGDLLSSYTILALDEVFLQGSNLVQSGAVGATTPGTGVVRLFQKSHVADFTQAANIELRQGSTVGTAIYHNATPEIPEFTANTRSNSASPDVTVAINQTQTLSESVYDVVDIAQNATVTFSASNIYINTLITGENARIEFSGCTNVLINNKFTLSKDGIINANGNNVVFYVNDDVQIDKGSKVRARMHLNDNELSVEGENSNGKNSSQPTYMTGLFIAKKVQGSLDIIWEADDVCEPCTPSGAIATIANKTKTDNPGLVNFEILSWPNPTDNVFSIKLKTENYTGKAQIKVFDIHNKLVHLGEFIPTEVHEFGESLQSGVYIIKVTQDEQTASVRVVKF